jgi:hypothetical protein
VEASISPETSVNIKSRRMRRAGHITHKGGVHTGSWWESQKERDH